MRLLVASDRIGALGSAHAGRVLAAGWPDASVAVLPVGEAGSGFLTAYADLLGASLDSWAGGDALVSVARTRDVAVLQVRGPRGGPGIASGASSRLLGESVARVLAEAPTRRLVVDLTGVDAHDAGAGMLAALGATGDRPLDRGVGGLEGVGSVHLRAASDRLAATELIGVVPAAERSRLLLGLRGITSIRGHEHGERPERLLRVDAALAAFAHSVAAPHATAAGAGACGGLGFAVLALGGTLTTGPALALQPPGSSPAARGADLVVSGCDVFDFATRGGGVVAAAAEAAAAALSPCIVVAGEVLIGAREMRTMGIEAAYAVRESTTDTPRAGVDEVELAATARRVARSWTW